MFQNLPDTLQKEKSMKKIVNAKIIMRLVLIAFIASIAYVTYRIVTAPSVPTPSDVSVRGKGDYVLMLVQCILGVLAILLPRYVQRRARLSIPSAMMIVYAVFLYCGIFLGEVRDFYYRIPHWDTILHAFSGVALGALGLSLISLLNKSNTVVFNLSPLFVAIFSFCFALALGALWEIYEFTVDSLLQINMQKYALETGELLVGQAALADTMKDLIVDAAGALVMSVVGFISLKRDNRWLERLQVEHLPGENTGDDA